MTAGRVWRGAGSCSPFAWLSSLPPSNSVPILRATFGDMWNHCQRTKRYCYCSVPGKCPLPGKHPCTCSSFQGVNVAASMQTYGSYIYMVSAHAGQNRELCLSAHGCLPRDTIVIGLASCSASLAPLHRSNWYMICTTLY